MRVSVVIPTLNAERYLAELIDALLPQGPDEVLIIDSGSTDRTEEIARSRPVGWLPIPPRDFGHGRTRNLGAEGTRGELIAFLTQDATPCPGWLDAYRRAFAADPAVGAAFGPHNPRPSTSPMIARELEEFFARLDPDEPFLSNVNACYRRACWEQIRFADVPYSEDQAFGRALTMTSWTKAYVPEAAVLHAHDYGPLDFMRRYFDEYRGLRATAGHVEPLRVRGLRSAVRADRAWMRSRGMPLGERARWTVRSVLHHGGRRAFSALGSRAPVLPGRVQRTLSLEGTTPDPADEFARHVAPVVVAGVPASRRIASRLSESDVDEIVAALDATTEPLWRSAHDDTRQALAPMFGVWHRVPAALEKTGLRPDEPPEDVHAMSRGPLSAGGVPYYGDMVAAMLERSGVTVEALERALDFGCSSGRVVRWLAAAYPEVEWHGADPNAGAIAWASEHLPEIRFLQSPTDPPLPYADGNFDLVLAVSVWSHYAAPAALAWLAEMRRVIKPAGHLWMTTHGLHSIAHQAAAGARSPGVLGAIRDAMYRSGTWFVSDFGPSGDHGVIHPHWGNSWTSAEWLLEHVTREWSVVDFAPGGNDGHQDVYLLQRR